MKDDNHREVTDQHECETVLINNIINVSVLLFFSSVTFNQGCDYGKVAEGENKGEFQRIAVLSESRVFLQGDEM